MQLRQYSAIYIYDTDYGKKSTMYSIDGREYQLKTVDDLWDIIEALQKEE